MAARVLVIATTFEGTRAALTTAVPLARGSGAQVVVVVPRIVSSGAERQIECQSTAIITQRYREIARDLGAEPDVEICVSVGLDDLVAGIRAAHAPVVVGGPVGRWLTSPEERFANRLALEGCQVVFVPCGANTTQRRIAA